MYKFQLIFSIVVLCLQINANTDQAQEINPYDLADEVKEQVAELRSIVRGLIYSSFTTIDGYVREVYYHRDDNLEAARIDIRQEHDTLSSQVTTLKDLAQSAGVNVDVCTANNGPLLEQLPETIIDSLLECLAFSNREVTIIQNESRYRIDTLINEVNIFDYEVDVCAGDILCMSPLVEQIELAKVSIPQKIGVELERASDLADELKVLITQCTNDKVAQYVTEGTIIFNDISDCINNLL